MILVKSAGAQVIRQIYDRKVIARLIGGIPQLIPVTPRLAIFTTGKRKIETDRPFGEFIPCQPYTPRPFLMVRPFVLVAFKKGQIESLTQWDLDKFNLLYQHYGEGATNDVAKEAAGG